MGVDLTSSQSFHFSGQTASQSSARSRKSALQFVLPVLAFLAMVGAGLGMAMYERGEFNADLHEATNLVREQLARRFEIWFSGEIHPLGRLQRDILGKNMDTPLKFEQSCQLLQKEIPAFQQIWWLDANGYCIGASAEPQSQAMVGHRLTDQPGWQPVAVAMAFQGDSLARLDGVQTESRQIVVKPIVREKDQGLMGFIVCRLRVAGTLSSLIERKTSRRFDVEVRDSAGDLLLPHHSDVAQPAEYSMSEPMHVLTATWQMSVWPLRRYVSHLPVRSGLLVFWVAVGLGFAAAWAVWQALVQCRRRAAYQAGIEALHDITAAIAEAPGKGREVLQRLTQIAADLLEMPMCVFSLWDESKECFEVIYSKGLTLDQEPKYYSFEELPATREAFRIGRPVFASDIRRHPGCFDREAAEKHGRRSTIIVPLQLKGQPVGMIALSDTRPRKFTRNDLRLASLWGAQAAVTIVNSELHRQTLRDAQAKAELLRELNHRVKNNLAGIAGLLCTSPVELPPDIRHWLERVIERVNGMSRMHELLVDGAPRISVPELVGKAIDSATLLWPNGVKLLSDLQGGQVSLSIDRAVTLAMVLHELLFNALNHGVCDRGTVWIASRVEQNHVIIDVIDDASKSASQIESSVTAASAGMVAQAATAVMDLPAAPAVMRGGIGLQLVRGLVGRELKGKFSFSTLGDGRTLARVVFPANP